MYFRLEQLDGVVITPYERNLEFWRQLWQVIERSDVLIQVVDARQPLLFFSSSLDYYIKSVDGHKETLILINKSDLLTTPQRCVWCGYYWMCLGWWTVSSNGSIFIDFRKVWAEYFDSINVRVLFFSALQAQEEQVDSVQPAPQVPAEKQKAPQETTTKKDFEEQDPSKETRSPELTPSEMCQDFDESSVTSSSDESTLCDEDIAEEEKDDGIDEQCGLDYK